MPGASYSNLGRGAASTVRRLVELAYLAFASPTAKSRGAGGKLSRPASLPFDRRAFRHEAEENVGGAGERQEQLLGGGTASRAVQDGDLQIPQNVGIPHQQIDVL